MKNRTSTMIVVAILLIAFATAVVASTLSNGNAGASHTMPDGSSMQGDDMP
jgi:hypothetical protein